MDAILAVLDEPVDAVLADFLLAGEPVFLLDLDLDPESLTVKPVLVAQFASVHGVVSLQGVLERPPPCVMDAHGIVGGHGAVEK